MINKVAAVLAVIAVVGGFAYRYTVVEPQRTAAHTAPQPKPKPKSKLAGAIVVSKQIMVDLAGGRYATVTVGLEVPPKWEEAFAESGVVREVVTRDLTNLEPADLLDRERRDRLKLRLARDIRTQTDVQVGRVLLTDFTIQ